MPRKTSMSSPSMEHRWISTFRVLAMTLVRGMPHIGFFIALVVLTIPPALSGEAARVFNGLPFTRSYALAEIGDIPRGARLSFDALGRIAVINDGSVIVLNDATWMDIAEKSPSGEPVLQFLREKGGTTYYCGQGAWGR